MVIKLNWICLHVYSYDAYHFCKIFETNTKYHLTLHANDGIYEKLTINRSDYAQQFNAIKCELQ